MATGSPVGREAPIVPTKQAPGKRTRALALLLVIPALAGQPARAQIPSAVPLPAGDSAKVTRLRFAVRAWPDAAILGGSAALALVPTAWPNAFPYATCAPCDPAHLWSLDRGAVGSVNRTADLLSDGTLGAEAVLGALFLASTRRGEGFAPFAEDAAVIAEALATTEAATEWTKILFHRPRPFLYVPGVAPPSADDGRSLPSGHTSIAFAAAAAYASLLHRRGIAARHRLQIAALFAAAAATGVLRVAAHKHFPTDVAAGAALGFAIGWTFPALHSARP